MPDPLWFVFGPGAAACVAVLALPVGLLMRSRYRRRAAARNREGRCGHCSAELVAGSAVGLYLVEGRYICAECAPVLRRRLWVLLPTLGALAIIAAASSTYGALAGGPGLGWYLNSRLIPLLLPAGGLGWGLFGGVRLMKRLNRQELASGDDGRGVPPSAAWPSVSLPSSSVVGPRRPVDGPMQWCAHPVVRRVAVAWMGLMGTLPVGAQTPGLLLRRGDSVVVRIPPAALTKASGFRTWVANVGWVDSVVTINRSVEWRSLGFTSRTPLRIADLKADPRKGMLQIRLDRQHAGGTRNQRDRLFVNLPLADTASLNPILFAPPAASGLVRAESYAAVGRRVFRDARDLMPVQVQDGILALADSLMRGDTIRVVTFRDRSYLQLRVIDSDENVTYNAVLTSEAKQVAGVLEGFSLPVVRILTGIVRVMGGGYVLPDSPGYAIVAPVKSQVPSGLLMQYPGIEERADLTLYVTGEAVSRYAAAELTAMELVYYHAVVMFKGKEVPVRLAE